MTADEALPPAEAAPVDPVIAPVRRVGRKVRLNAEQQRLLDDYNAGVARREAERAAAAAAPTPPDRFEARPRSRRSADDVVPINPMRLCASDGPPPATFDPERAPAGCDTPTPSVWRHEPQKQTPPATGRVAG